MVVKIFALIALVLNLGFQPTEIENVGFYPTTMVVVNVDYETDLVTIATFSGMEYQFEGCEDWFEGDVCSVLMCDNGTEKIFDDVIVSTRYSGWVESWGYDHESGEPLYYFDFD